MENPCDESLIRGTAAVLVRSVAAIAVGAVDSKAMFMSILSGTRAASARFGHAQAIVRRGEPVQLQFWVRIFGRNRNRSARYCGARGGCTISE